MPRYASKQGSAGHRTGRRADMCITAWQQSLSRAPGMRARHRREESRGRDPGALVSLALPFRWQAARTAQVNCAARELRALMLLVTEMRLREAPLSLSSTVLRPGAAAGLSHWPLTHRPQIGGARRCRHLRRRAAICAPPDAVPHRRVRGTSRPITTSSCALNGPTPNPRHSRTAASASTSSYDRPPVRFN